MTEHRTASFPTPAWRRLPRIGMVLAFAVMVIVFSILSPVFFTWGNFINIANQTAVISILAFGMTLVMLSGGIDLSVGSLVSLSAVVCALALGAGWPAPAAVTASLALGASFGALSGAIAVRWQVQTFLVTLGALSVARGLSLVLSGGRTVYIESEGFLAFTAQGAIGPVPVLFAWTLAALAGCWVLLNLTRFGRYLRALGGNPEAARHAGVRTGWVTVRVFALSGTLAAFGGLLMAGRLSGGLPSVGVGMELDAIAAAVLGGTGFRGEGGSLAGTLFGALVMGTVINGLTLLGVNPYIQEIAKGVIIVAAVVLVSLRR